MGLFDYITCEYPLPTKAQTLQFQTKDTDAQYLEQYKITKDGRLLHLDGDYMPTPLEDRPNFGKPGFEDSPIMQALGSISHVNEHWVDTNFHGKLCFYSSIGVLNSTSYEWFEFIGLFKDGQLIDLKQIKNEV